MASGRARADKASGRRAPKRTSAVAETGAPATTSPESYEDAPVAYVTFNPRGVIQSLNLQARRLLKLDPAQAVGLPLRSCVTKADQGEFSVHLARLLAEGRATSEVRLLSSGNGETTIRLDSRRTLRDPELYWTTLFDVSQQKRAEVEHARLEDSERSARAANTVKDRFIAVLSHELRAPLAPILVALGSIESGAESPAKVRRLCEIIRRNVQREARLIDDLLDLSRVASGKVGLQSEVVDLHLCAQESLEMLSAEARARHLSLTLALEASRHWLIGDPSRLQQVLTNLLKNAVKFTPEGGAIAVRSWNHGDTVTIEVSDNGIGIPREALGRIFESFEQANRSASGGGLGLGLAIARGMIELHGGRISAHSAGPGRGARFVVELPALPTNAQRPDQPLAPASSPPPKHAPRATEILLVEDEPDLAETMVIALEAEGYHVRTAATARAALDADLDNVQLVISDIGLPDLDGRRLVEKLKSKHDLKAIALSGYGTEADILASEAAGFDRHLTKPIEIGVLLGAVDRACADL